MYAKDNYAAELNHYIRRLDDMFDNIISSNAPLPAPPQEGTAYVAPAPRVSDFAHKNSAHIDVRLNDLRKRVAQIDCALQIELNDLRARLYAVRDMANAASQSRYLATQTHEVILANLIMQVLNETNLESSPQDDENSFFFDVLASSKELKLEEALEGFEFYDNNPYKEKAEKYLARIKRKRSY